MENNSRWYCINSEGLATLCADQGDAKRVAAESDAAFPRFAPHAASRMVAIDSKNPACSRLPRTAAYLVHGEEDTWVEITQTEGSNLRRDELVKRDDAIAYAAACAAGWQRPPAIGNPGDLISFAEGRIEHANRGHCPGAHEGFDSRDPDCEVCKAINAALSPAASEFDVEAIYEAFKTWPDDIRRKLSFHDLRRMNGWMPKPTTPPGAADEAIMARAKEMFDSQKDKLAVDWERQWQPTKDYWIAKARAELTSAGIGQVDFGMQSRSDAWKRVAGVLGEVSPNWVISRNGMSGVECAVDEIKSLAKAAGRADAGVQIAGWINEDALPDGYPYDVMFPHSKVDGVRLFPVYAPTAAAEKVFQPIDQAPKNGAGILALLPDSSFPVGIRWWNGNWCVAWDNSPLGEFDQPVKFMHIPDEDATALVIYLAKPSTPPGAVDEAAVARHLKAIDNVIQYRLTDGDAWMDGITKAREYFAALTAAAPQPETKAAEWNADDWRKKVQDGIDMARLTAPETLFANGWTWENKAWVRVKPEPAGSAAVGIIGERGNVSWRSETILPIGTKLYASAPIAETPKGFVLVPSELTAENGAKAAFLGEKFDGVAVSWTGVKAVHRAVVAWAESLTGAPDHGR